MNKIGYVVVEMACRSLSNEELAAINNVVNADFDPRKVKGYEKVKHLFTEDNGLKMHEEIKDTLAYVVGKRLIKNE